MRPARQPQQVRSDPVDRVGTHRKVTVPGTSSAGCQGHQHCQALLRPGDPVLPRLDRQPHSLAQGLQDTALPDALHKAGQSRSATHPNRLPGRRSSFIQPVPDPLRLAPSRSVSLRLAPSRYPSTSFLMARLGRVKSSRPVADLGGAPLFQPFLGCAFLTARGASAWAGRSRSARLVCWQPELGARSAAQQLVVLPLERLPRF